MIKVKMSTLLDSTDALKKLAGMPLKARLAFQVARLLKAADAEISNFNETRMNLIKKYGEKDEMGELVTDEKGNCKIPNEFTESFSDELNELVNSEVEINGNMLHMEDIENLDFTPSEMVALESFIEFEDEPEVVEIPEV